MPVDYYTRLEQARGPRPSRQIVAALARAVRLSDAERDYLAQLAGMRKRAPPARAGTSRPARTARAGAQRRALAVPPGAAERAGDGERRLAHEAVADLRAASDRYPDDAGVRDLVAELRASSEWFAALWDAHDVRVSRTNSKRIDHPVVGSIVVDIETLLVRERDQRVVIYTTSPGTSSHQALQLLRVIGTQDLASVPVDR